MKKVFAAILVVTVLVVAVAGCSKDKDKIFPGIAIDLADVAGSVPAVPFALPFEVPIDTVAQHFNLDSLVKANTNGDFSATDVKSVLIKNVTFNVTNADSANNVANFEMIRVKFYSSSKSDVIELAQLNFPDQYATSYTYTPGENTPQLRPYLDGDTLYYIISGKNRRATSKALDVALKATVLAK